MTEELPALHGMTSSEVFAEHLNALHAARRTIIQTEADERIRRALRNKIRAAEQVFNNGDIVFYKREGKVRWLGPGKVVVQDGKIVFVRDGAFFVRVSPNSLQKINSSVTAEHSEFDKHELENTRIEYDEETEDGVTHTILEDIPTNGFKEACLRENNESKKIFKSNDKIQYKIQEDDDWVQAKVLGRAGKATGRNKKWYNVQEIVSNEKKSINLEQVQWEILTEDVNVNAELEQVTGSQETNVAKLNELQKLAHFKTYEEVND